MLYRHLCFLVVVAVLLAALADGQGHRCGPNKIYYKCGRACPRVCQQPPPDRCSPDCVAGCFCKRGFIRDKNDECITERKCFSRGR
ncbi:chymotrypsin-elastase inhibitor ixodidin-like [Haemaphysalis longicornis]